MLSDGHWKEKQDVMRLFDRMDTLSTDTDFLHFQHDLIRRLYDALGRGYSASDNEVNLIKRAVDSLNGLSYKGLRLFATVIHGTRSYVEFNFMDKPVTKELGDMTIITLVSDKESRLYQRVCVIQNKKERDGHWEIDPEQLFLLKNFPPFSGNKGIFRRCKEMAFRNSSGTLGCYGLFCSPGEMTLVSAPALTEMLRGKRCLSRAELGYPSSASVGGSGAATGAPWWPGFPRLHPKEFYMFLEEFVHHCGHRFMAGGLLDGFLGCTQFAGDLHDFVRNWTQLNLGEVTTVLGRVLNPTVDAFSNFMIRSAGFRDLHVELPTGNYFSDQEFDGQMAVLLMHMDVSRLGG